MKKKLNYWTQLFEDGTDDTKGADTKNTDTKSTDDSKDSKAGGDSKDDSKGDEKKGSLLIQTISLHLLLLKKIQLKDFYITLLSRMLRLAMMSNC